MAKKMSKAEKKWHELTDGKVLIAKPGMEDKFAKALEETAKIAHGSLGWDGQAEIWYDLGIAEQMGLQLKKGSKKQQVKQIRDYIVQVYLSSIYEAGEWVTPEEAEKRRVATKILYEPK